MVTTIVSNPNTDPHDYESTNATARTFADADYVIENGAGYDSWADKLLGANPTPQRSVLNVATLLGKNDGDNPHFWYNPAYVNSVISQMHDDLVALDPDDTDYYDQQLSRLQDKLNGYQARIADIRLQDADAEVASTEDVFAYLADSAALKLVTPPDFMSAVAEGNDPPTASVATFQKQLQSGRIRMLVYNKQTTTPLTENLKKLAINHHIPVVGVTETVQPANATFQDWMDAQLAAMQQALDKKAQQ